MFRGKESSNRIELSRLIQDFGVSGSLRLWGVGDWVDGVVWGGWKWVGGGCGVPHTHAHACTCMHTHTCMHGKHDNFIQMATPLDLGKSQGFPMMSCMCMCTHAHLCMYVGGILSPPPPHPPTPTPWGTPRISQNSIALELIEIFQFCLKI